MKRTSFVLFLVLLLCSLVGTCAAASAATGAVPLRPTPDKEIPREAETVLHRLKQACSSNCIEDNFQISDKQDLNERLCKDFCRFIFYAFKKNSKEFYGLVKSNSLSAIDFAMKDVMVLKYGNNKQQEVANLFMEKVRLYAKTTETKEEL